jgi:MFS family permease
VFAALAHRNFRLLWIGLSASFTGSYMQTATILWHVSLLAPPGRKGLALGMVGLVRVVPIVLFSMLAGVAADAFDRRRLMLVTQSLAALVAAALALLAYRGVDALWPVYLLAALASSVNAFDPPARHSLVPMLVPRATLPNAINLNSTVMQMASVAGPAIGGLIIASAGVPAAYTVNVVAALVVVFALVAMRDVPARQGPSAREMFSVPAALSGLQFVFRTPVIRSTMLLDFFATFFASAMALLPMFAQDILKVGAEGYGILAAAPAAGALTASILMLPLTPRLTRHGTILVIAVLCYGVATALFGLSRTFWFALVCLGLTGASDSVSTIIRNLIRQLETPDELRGRMMGVNMVFFQGGPQLGELEAGLVAQWIGAARSVVVGGIGCLVATVIVVAITPAIWRYRVRP